MKKLIKRLVFLSIIMVVITLSIIKLYSTYATGEGQTPDETFVFNLSGTTTVSIEPLSSKIVYYQTTSNTQEGDIAYGVAYTAADGVTVRAWEGYDANGVISPNETKTVKLKISNTSNTTKQTTLSTLLGYVNGGNLIIPDNNTILVSSNPIVYNTNTLVTAGTVSNSDSVFLGTTIKRNEIESITFTNDNIVPEGTIGSFNVGSDTGRTDAIKLWYTAGDTEGLYKVYIGSDNGISSFPGNSRELFRYLSNMQVIDFNTYVDTSNVTSMYLLFNSCSSLTSLDLSFFDTSSVNTMNSLLSVCTNLEEVNVSSFDTSNVVSFYGMFSNCTSLKKLDLSNFDTSSITGSGYARMFYKCSSLQRLDLSNFVGNPTDMNGMFWLCSNLEYVNLSSLNTENVTNMQLLFHLCSKLKYIDIRNFDFTNVTGSGVNGTFNVPKAAEIIVKDCAQYNLFTEKWGTTYTGLRTKNYNTCS